MGELRDSREVVRWLEEGQRQLPALAALVQENERLRGRLEMAEGECEKLRGLIYEVEQLRDRSATAEKLGDRLREQLNNAEAELERQNRERTDLAERLTDFMNDVLVRLRPRPSVAAEAA